MKKNDNQSIRDRVRDRYAQIAKGNGSCCNDKSCCTNATEHQQSNASIKIGYSTKELEAVPEDADMGLGCGNPQAIANLKPGETVLDLGSGGGFDCFLAARQVGNGGRVIGIDMTPEMISKARTAAQTAGYVNVEFRLGEIEHLPVSDNSVDVIMSNCVINLSPDKKAVFADAFRVLRNGGRLAISDIVAIGELPAHIRESHDAYCSCAAGAVSVEEVKRMLHDAGFTEISVQLSRKSREYIKDWLPGSGVENSICSAIIEAVKQVS